jgi:hypothetical protein
MFRGIVSFNTYSEISGDISLSVIQRTLKVLSSEIDLLKNGLNVC